MDHKGMVGHVLNAQLHLCSGDAGFATCETLMIAGGGAIGF
jgi:hypothetical protein